MLTRLNKRSKGQSTAEYAILIGLVIAAAVAMQIYVKRGLQARVHDASLYLAGKTATIGDSTQFQYEPYYINSQFNVVRVTNSGVDLKDKAYNSFENALITREGGGSQKYEWDKATDENR